MLGVLERLDGLLVPAARATSIPRITTAARASRPICHDLERDATTLRLIPEALARGMPRAGDLPRHPGTERRPRRHAASAACMTVPGRHGPSRRARARSKERYAPRHLVPVRPARAHRRQHEDPGELAARPGDRPPRRRGWWSRRGRRTARSRRCASRTRRASRWACNGIRSGAMPTTARAWRCSALSARRARRYRIVDMRRAA